MSSLCISCGYFVACSMKFLLYLIIMASVIGLLVLGFLLGLKHATDTDHIVAMSTFVSQTKSLKKSSLSGVLWGLGHTLTLFVIGGLILLFKITVSKKVALGLELPVGIMLIFLGIRLIINTSKQKNHSHAHASDDGVSHKHLHSHQNSKSHRHIHQSFWMGLVHGLAGSAALVLLVLGTTHSTLQGLVFILIFGVGSILGMLLISTLISVPVLLTSHFEKFDHGLQLAAGAISILVGLIAIYELIFVQKLFA